MLVEDSRKEEGAGQGDLTNPLFLINPHPNIAKCTGVWSAKGSHPVVSLSCLTLLPSPGGELRNGSNAHLQAALGDSGRDARSNLTMNQRGAEEGGGQEGSSWEAGTGPLRVGGKGGAVSHQGPSWALACIQQTEHAALTGALGRVTLNPQPFTLNTKP